MLEKYYPQYLYYIDESLPKITSVTDFERNVGVDNNLNIDRKGELVFLWLQNNSDCFNCFKNTVDRELDNQRYLFDDYNFV